VKAIDMMGGTESWSAYQQQALIDQEIHEIRILENEK
jgi:hypothetical protein